MRVALSPTLYTAGQQPDLGSCTVQQLLRVHAPSTYAGCPIQRQHAHSLAASGSHARAIQPTAPARDQVALQRHLNPRPGSGSCVLGGGPTCSGTGWMLSGLRMPRRCLNACTARWQPAQEGRPGSSCKQGAWQRPAGSACWQAVLLNGWAGAASIAAAARRYGPGTCITSNHPRLAPVCIRANLLLGKALAPDSPTSPAPSTCIRSIVVNVHQPTGGQAVVQRLQRVSGGHIPAQTHG